MAPSIDPSAHTFLLFAGSAAAALLGGWHCLAMCGPIASVNCGPKKSFAYQSGRLVIYLLLGFLAGFAGDFLFGILPRGQRTWALVLIGVTSLWLIASSSGVWDWQKPFFRKIWALRPHLPWVNGNFLLGILNGFIPCGWLYAFLLVAAGAGSSERGALVMLGLWAGALPWLSSAALVSSQLQRLGPYQKWVQVALAGMVLLSLFMIPGPAASCH